MPTPPGDVVDRLERLAARAPVAPADPDLLWSRGRRRQGRRVAASLAGVAAAGVLATAVTPVALERLDRPVAAASTRMVLPDVLRTPGSWEPAFPATPVRLSAVGVGERSGLLSSTPSLWGVSAATGETRWLDLPDLVPASHVPPELSADGRRVAYWVTGPTSGEPLGNGGPTRRGETEEVTPVVGVAVLDLATGAVVRWEIASEHGLSVNGLAWAGDVLWWRGGPLTSLGQGATSAELATYTWDVTTDERLEVEGEAGGAGLTLSRAGDAPGGFVTLPRTFRLDRVTGARATGSSRVELPAGTPSSAGLTDPEMAPDGATVAALVLANPTMYDATDEHDLVVGTRAGGVLTLQTVGGVRAQSVLGWRSPTEVVVSSPTAVDDGLSTGQQVWVVDVTTGERTELLDVAGALPDSVAAEAWAADVVDAPGAPFAPDPRVVGLGGMVVLVFCVSLWRDLRRRRGHA